MSDSQFISIHAPREGGDQWLCACGCIALISIHAPREGGDGFDPRSRTHIFDFNPRPPRGGRPRSILYSAQDLDFNPRPPRGGRQGCKQKRDTLGGFQSTPPARGATQCEDMALITLNISIHAPREGGDISGFAAKGVGLLFQSTPPARGATSRPCIMFARMIDFNPRPPRGGRRPASRTA